ncbi:TlpA family protein disulfide reductase [Flammeovirga kamogawensis]|uniref:TlpA family protein disulfide reductase n=1 Tax=Flammeovirga kamogawensis TaxID=373891 RepID=A0ABX8GSI9_9BACT|nr:TlpA disulfide reductase family protein [Flammeovirga kamogawensis]MBB6461358.1 thiol-disulfide isomerase/thioredoxin [Flammeovirga kamogawensis]QWG06263.1 TlpA family protein disulfide reductase [Flammeovirga kamogawensis]TRX68093.1 TlpA family protein disulfide reductase [Flammeovirga kamogawensis]
MRKSITIFFTFLSTLLSCQTQQKTTIKIKTNAQNVNVKSLKEKVINSDTISSLIDIKEPQYITIEIDDQFLSVYSSPYSQIEIEHDNTGINFKGDYKRFNTALYELRQIDKSDYYFETNLPINQYYQYRDSIDQLIKNISVHELNNDEKELFDLEVKTYQLLSKFNAILVRDYINKENNFTNQEEETVLKEIFNQNQYLETGSGPYQSLSTGLMYTFLDFRERELKTNPFENTIDNINIPSNILEVIQAIAIKVLLQSTSDITLIDQTILNYQQKFPISPYIEEFKNDYQDYVKLKKGGQAKDIIAFNSKGDSVSLFTYKEQILILDVWATWCPPCLKAFEGINELEQKYSNKNISFLKVSIDNDFEKWKKSKYVEEGNHHYNIPRSSLNSFFNDYRIKTISRYIIIDKNRRFINAHAKLNELDSIIQNNI